MEKQVVEIEKFLEDKCYSVYYLCQNGYQIRPQTRFLDWEAQYDVSDDYASFIFITEECDNHQWFVGRFDVEDRGSSIEVYIFNTQEKADQYYDELIQKTLESEDYALFVEDVAYSISKDLEEYVFKVLNVRIDVYASKKRIAPCKYNYAIEIYDYGTKELLLEEGFYDYDVIEKALKEYYSNTQQ